MGISSSGFHFKNAFFNGKNGYIESTTAKIENQDIPFAADLLVQTWNENYKNFKFQAQQLMVKRHIILP